MPRVLRVSATHPQAAVIADAAAVLSQGGLVAFPTETVYGLGARGLHADEVARIFAAKQRPPGHPLILHVDGEGMARALALTWPDSAARLACAFWPGPLTLVVERAPFVPAVVSGGAGTVGLRAPLHPVAMALIRAVGEPLAAPSANAHLHVSPTTAAHVVRSLGDRVDLVLDAGPCAHGIESTVVDVTTVPPRVLRAGATRLEAIRALLPDVAYDSPSVAADHTRPSPGMASKHYAPRTRVVLGDAGARFRSALAPLVDDATTRVGAILWSEAARRDISVAHESAHESDRDGDDERGHMTGPGRVVVAWLAALPRDAEGYGRTIFAALHEADDAKLDVLVVEQVPDAAEWWAVADRLRRAAGD